VFIWTLPSTERALWTVTLAAWAVGVSTLTWEHYKPTWLLFALVMTAWARSYAGAPDALTFTAEREESRRDD
jgi:hypothetical protein